MISKKTFATMIVPDQRADVDERRAGAEDLAVAPRGGNEQDETTIASASSFATIRHSAS